jgi:ferredoxin-NADP reductase
MTDTRVGWQEATIQSITHQTPTVVSVVLKPEVWHETLAGQHVEVRLTAPDGYQARRSYSITSAPSEDGVFELAIERLKDGEVSSYFHEIALPNDLVEVSGPFTTHFVWRGTDPGPVLLIGGGSGVAPLIAMARHHARLASTTPMLLCYSVRTWADVMFRDELLARDADASPFSCVFAVTRDTPRRSVDVSARFDAANMATLLTRLPAPPALSYICGNTSFVNDMATVLEQCGLPARAIRTERFGGA